MSLGVLAAAIVSRVRIFNRRHGLVALVVIAQAAFAYLPAPAGADGFEQGLPCHYLGPNAVLPPPVHFDAIPGAVFVPPTYEFTYGKGGPPASSFTATANWGDGTTSPAIVRECYDVSAQGHAYASPGTYSFSYTVHDPSTGLDHVIGSKLVYIVSALPELIPDSSEIVVHATTGIVWKGQLATFRTTPVSQRPDFAYSSSIDWGDGQITPATTASPVFGTLAVSGSHTYSRPLSTAIKVSMHSGNESATWTTAKVLVTASIPPYRFVGSQIPTAISTTTDRSKYAVVFRLNRALPRTTAGRVRASLSAFGISSPVRTFGAHATRACYLARTERPSASHHPHRSYAFVLHIQTPSNIEQNGSATVRHFSSETGMLKHLSRQLSC